MLRHLADPANAITSSGIVFSAIGLTLLLSGEPVLAVAVTLWAMLADQLDGIVAGRLQNRPADAAAMGKSLDGYADLIYGAVIPAAVVITLNDGSPLAYGLGAALLLAGALRLSYFSNFGLAGGRYFTGVPLSYDVPVIAALFLVEPFLPDGVFLPLLNASLLALAVCHVAPIRVPAPRFALYLAIVGFSTIASLALALRELAPALPSGVF